jgi:AmmeMemoRadiSam system protein A
VNADLLLWLARRAIETSFSGRELPVPGDPLLQSPGAAFVTIRDRATGDLRGCVGTLEASVPLGSAIVSAARAAAFRDDRFGPLKESDLPDVRLDLSILSLLSRLPVSSEADACAVLERTRPGVVLKYGRHRGVLLPKVWESIPEPAAFLEQLKRKAGLPHGFWSSDVRLEVFTCDEFSESADSLGGEAG